MWNEFERGDLLRKTNRYLLFCVGKNWGRDSLKHPSIRITLTWVHILIVDALRSEKLLDFDKSQSSFVLSSFVFPASCPMNSAIPVRGPTQT